MSDQLDNDRDITWRVLREMIDAMPEERLDDIVEIMTGDVDDYDEPVALHKVIGCNSIKYWSTSGTSGDPIENYTRSAVDNRHHPERYALLADVNPFDEDGNFAFEWDIDRKTRKGIPTGNVYVDEEVPTTEWWRKRVDDPKRESE